MPQPLLILAHPGHELRVWGWVRRLKPHVAILTDGSGSAQAPRIERSVKNLEAMGCTLSRCRGLYSDQEVYRKIKDGDFAFFDQIASWLVEDRNQTEGTIVVSDMREGYSPTHDLAQALAQTAIKLSTEGSEATTHLTFPLTGLPGSTPDGRSPSVTLDLSDAEFEEKVRTARDYEELAQEVDLLERQGILNSFKTELLFPGDKDILSDEFLEQKPYYETYGEAQVEKGVYKDLLTYSDHLRPLLKHLDTL